MEHREARAHDIHVPQGSFSCCLHRFVTFTRVQRLTCVSQQRDGVDRKLRLLVMWYQSLLLCVHYYQISDGPVSCKRPQSGTFLAEISVNAQTVVRDL